MKPTHHIVYSFQSFKDPLFTGLMFRYLMDLQKDNSNKFVFHLITHEQTQFRMSRSEMINVKKKCLEANIIWYPVTYHNGRFLLLKKLFDFSVTFFMSLYIRLRFKTKLIIGFLPIAGGFGSILGKFLNMKLAIYCYEPHSEYMVDFRIWDRTSLKFKLLHLYEQIQLDYASYIVVPTTHSMDLVKKSKAKKYVLPISVDTELFTPNKSYRKQIREKYNLTNEILLLYTGKFGGIYYSISEVISFLSKLIEVDNRFVVMIISINRLEILNFIKESGLPENKFILLDYVDYKELPAYINANDLGIVAVPPLPSQKYRTPVKTGLYLACGLPYLVNEGIAEDDLIAKKENIGIVLKDFQNIDFELLKEKIVSLLKSVGLEERCRKYADNNRSIKLATNTIKEIILNSIQKK